jgi:hypothetical protein
VKNALMGARFPLRLLFDGFTPGTDGDYEWKN